MFKTTKNEINQNESRSVVHIISVALNRPLSLEHVLMPRCCLFSFFFPFFTSLGTKSPSYFGRSA